MRLDRLVSELSGCTRKQAKELLRAGRVTCNGRIMKTGEATVDERSDQVMLDDRLLVYERYVIYMMNKPAGVVSATEDSRQKTVLDLLAAKDKGHRELFPVGRLDKDTEGLLLLTDDGALAHRLLSPKKHVEKLYYVKLRRPITEEDIALFACGMRVDDELTAMPAKLYIPKEEEQRLFVEDDEPMAAVILKEGKFHQVKRMFAATGNEVTFLKRMAMGGLWLDKALKPGEYRLLTQEECDLLQ